MGIGRRIKNALIGKPLESSQLSREKLSVFWGLPIMASDAVSSVAYAIEEILLVLVPALALAAFSHVLTVTAPIILLLLILIYSYSQIIKLYPGGGGAYIVSMENFGRKTALLAASTLIIAYVLTVSVSISSATEALFSAFPELEPHRIVICLAGIALITLLNLRGVGESAKIFGVPVYAFIALMLILLVTGFVKLLRGSLTEIPYAEGVRNATGSASTLIVFLLLRAFSSGCSALTGVEAVSNAVPLFREPSRRTAIRVLCLLGAVIVCIFGGTALLATRLKVLPGAGETVLSQIGRAVFGNGALYYALQALTMLILLLAANTAYNGLPTLLSILARDSYIPRQFAHRGARLSFSNGISFIWIAASALVLIFGADTHKMIPLYASGVFITFTLSQAGMFVHWVRAKSEGWRAKALANAVGTLITTVGGAVVLITKFTTGAWLLLIVLPALMVLMSKIHGHYSGIVQEIDREEFRELYHPSVSNSREPIIVLMNRLTRSGVKLLNYANSLSANVRALSIVENAEQEAELRDRWREWELDVELDVIYAPYRDIVAPLHEYVTREEAKLDKSETLSVVMTKFVDNGLYAVALHNQTPFFLQRELCRHRKVATILVPYIYS
ncbi:MAG: APC family permease [Oscillospiraceae bacterium]|jgi:amino acid transporter|nr:APC family permease [Oscillospiraceae bacterium]